MLEHAPVEAAEQVAHVLALVPADPRHVRVEARLPAAIAGAARELDPQLARGRGSAGRAFAVFARFPEPRIEPRGSADVLEIGPHAVQVQRGTRDQMDGG